MPPLLCCPQITPLSTIRTPSDHQTWAFVATVSRLDKPFPSGPPPLSFHNNLVDLMGISQWIVECVEVDQGIVMGKRRFMRVIERVEVRDEEEEKSKFGGREGTRCGDGDGRKAGSAGTNAGSDERVSAASIPHTAPCKPTKPTHLTSHDSRHISSLARPAKPKRFTHAWTFIELRPSVFLAGRKRFITAPLPSSSSSPITTSPSTSTSNAHLTSRPITSSPPASLNPTPSRVFPDQLEQELVPSVSYVKYRCPEHVMEGVVWIVRSLEWRDVGRDEGVEGKEEKEKKAEKSVVQRDEERGWEKDNEKKFTNPNSTPPRTSHARELHYTTPWTTTTASTWYDHDNDYLSTQNSTSTTDQIQPYLHSHYCSSWSPRFSRPLCSSQPSLAVHHPFCTPTSNSAAESCPWYSPSTATASASASSSELSSSLSRCVTATRPSRAIELLYKKLAPRYGWATKLVLERLVGFGERKGWNVDERTVREGEMKAENDQDTGVVI